MQDVSENCSSSLLFLETHPRSGDDVPFNDANALALMPVLQHEHLLEFRGVVCSSDADIRPKYLLFEPVLCTLRQHVASLKRPLSSKECKRIAYDMLLALEYLQTKDAPLCALTPDNVFACRYADGFITFKLGNLMCGRLCPPRARDLYTAPEVRNTGRVDYSALMHSFGVIMLELMAIHAMPDSMITEFTSTSALRGMAKVVCEYTASLAKADFGLLLKDCTLYDADRPTPKQAREILHGTNVYIRTLSLVMGDSAQNTGLAVSPDEKTVVVAHSNGTLSVYALPSGLHVRTFGSEGSGPGQFHAPGKICFSKDGNVLVAEFVNQRVQEVTLTGEHVRFIGVGVIDGGIIGLAAQHDLGLIAVGKWDGRQDNRIMLFDAESGELVRAFGNYGSEVGQLRYCNGLRFFGKRLVVVEGEFPRYRLSMFTHTGAFVSCVKDAKYMRAHDIDFSVVTGEGFVADTGRHAVDVLSPNGGKHVYTIGAEYSDEDGRFKSPCAVAVRGTHLYVLDNSSPRVQILE